jgi:hypothetical protein
VRVIIVAGNAGGASAAARLRRLDEKAEIVVYEKGDYISFANCGLSYHIGGVIADRSQLLVQTPASMKERFNIDFLTGRVSSLSSGPPELPSQSYKSSLFLSAVITAHTMTLRYGQEGRTNESPQRKLGADWVQYRGRTT